MSLISLSILPIFFLFLFNFPITQPANNTSSLIYKTCKNSSDDDPNISFNFCLTSLQPAAAKKGHGAIDLRYLGLVSLRLILRNVNSTRQYIKHLRRNKGLVVDPYVKSCLDDCLELYSDAISTLKEARRDYKARRYYDANLKVSAVIDYCSTCEDQFKEKEGVISPLTSRDHNAFELSAIALSIIYMLPN